MAVAEVIMHPPGHTADPMTDESIRAKRSLGLPAGDGDYSLIYFMEEYYGTRI